MTPTRTLNMNSVGHENLRTLCILRTIPLAGLFYGAYFLLTGKVENLHWEFIFALLASLLVVIALTWWRSYRAKPISQIEFFLHLLIDIAIYSLLMFNTGGASNPFISYLLVPITIAAIALPPVLTGLIGALSLASYTLLLFWHIPLPLVSPGYGSPTPHHGEAVNLHVIGMWLNFMVSALLIAFFVNRMSRTIAQQSETLHKQQQKQLEDEQVLAVATLAASAAHELGTPLNTIKLIGDEWGERNIARGDSGFADDLAILNQQVERCQQTLQKLSGKASEVSDRGLRRQNANSFFSDLLNNWLVMRPDVNANITFVDSDASAEIAYHPSLPASIHKLLNNAGDASPEKRPIPSEKPAGMGLGLFLARTILSRHSAEVQFLPQPAGKGTLVRVKLPLGPDHD